jgi:uncharacterized protein (DUF433 family)
MTMPVADSIIPMLDYLEETDPDTIRVKGHRIGLEQIIKRYHAGYSAEQIALEFPGLQLEAIYAIVAFYLRHQAQLDAYLARIQAQAEAAYQVWLQAPRSAASERIRALRRSHQVHAP